MICVADFRDLCPRTTLSPTFPLHCNGLNSIRAGFSRTFRGLVTDFVANISTCRDGLCPRLSWFVSATFTETLWLHDLSPFVSTTFMISVHNFPRGEVSVKVGIMEFGLYWYNCVAILVISVSGDSSKRWFHNRLVDSEDSCLSSHWHNFALVHLETKPPWPPKTERSWAVRHSLTYLLTFLSSLWDIQLLVVVVVKPLANFVG